MSLLRTASRLPLASAWLAAACLAATVTAAASAQAPVAERVSATVTECHVAVDQAGRYATFAGQMQAVSGTARMAMRIDLRERDGLATGFRAVDAPGLGIWRDSALRVRVFRYVNRVTNLSAPASFRALIRFRWLDAHGRTLRETQRRTPVCRQPDERPLLAVGAVHITAARSSPNAQYEITVRNDGRGPAGAFDVVLTVGGVAQQPQTVPSLAPFSRIVLNAVAPRCSSATTVVVELDPQHQVPEATGGGQAQSVACPLAPVGGARGAG